MDDGEKREAACNIDEPKRAGQDTSAGKAAPAEIVRQMVRTIHAEKPGKEQTRRFYNSFHEQMRAAPFGKYSFFLNLGYVANENRQFSPVELPRHAINRNCIKLALEVIGDCDIAGRAVLDVGCGRGGMIWTLNEFFDARAMVGLDLSEGAISFCREVHVFPHTEFILGDAENLPFDDASFDVVVNMESSHHYFDIRAFYDGVDRVLAPGGHFLYATLLPVGEIEAGVKYLCDLGFLVEREQDVTTNVMASCEELAKAQYAALGREGVDAVAADANALPGTPRYERMKNGQDAYVILRLRKSGC